MSKDNERLKKDTATLREENYELKEDNTHLSSHETFLSLTIEYGGTSRVSVCSKEWHGKNTDTCKELFGFKSLQDTHTRLEYWWPDLTVEFSLELDSQVNEYEKCPVTTTRFHRRVTLKHLQLI